MGRVRNKVVVVTGAAGGQGAAEAQALASEGATVIATDLDARRISATAITVPRRSDVTSEEGWRELARLAALRARPRGRTREQRRHRAAIAAARADARGRRARVRDQRASAPCSVSRRSRP